MISWHKSFRGMPWYTAVDKQNGIRAEIFQGGPDKRWFTNLTSRPEESDEFPMFTGCGSAREAAGELVEKLDRKIQAYAVLRDAIKERMRRE